MTEKKNPDYSGSAVNLSNPPQVIGLLKELHLRQDKVTQLTDKTKEYIPQELINQIAEATSQCKELQEALRKAIDEFGSYQDSDKGEYALKQKRESIIYKPELVRQYAPSKVASFVLVESVDTKALDALVKAGQLTAVEARQCGEIKESFAYIIR